MKKTIHALMILDKSTSMQPHTANTIEGVNANIAALRKEHGSDMDVLFTELQFSSENGYMGEGEKDFTFRTVGASIVGIEDITNKTYVPCGGTPLLDAIGKGVEKVRTFHGDAIDDENLKIIVTIVTDGEENTSRKYDKEQIKKMIDHYQKDGKWTFTFVGCGSLDSVTTTSANLGISSTNTVAYADNNEGRTMAFRCVSDSYTTYASAVRSDSDTSALFGKKK